MSWEVKLWLLLGASSILAERDLYRAVPAGTRGLCLHGPILRRTPRLVTSYHKPGVLRPQSSTELGSPRGYIDKKCDGLGYSLQVPTSSTKKCICFMFEKCFAKIVNLKKGDLHVDYYTTVKDQSMLTKTCLHGIWRNYWLLICR